jgi:Holliday junction resolvase
MNRTDVFVLGLLLGGLFLLFSLRYWNSHKRQKYLKRAKRGEKEAIKLLENKGYTIIGIQEKKTIVTWINGKPKNNHLTVDLIAKRRGKTYIVEVKTGKKASSPLLAGIRRQLLEYFLAFNPHGMILVDMEKKALHEIAFEICENDKKCTEVLVTLIIGLFGLICGWFLYKFANGGIR